MFLPSFADFSGCFCNLSLFGVLFFFFFPFKVLDLFFVVAHKIQVKFAFQGQERGGKFVIFGGRTC